MIFRVIQNPGFLRARHIYEAYCTYLTEFFISSYAAPLALRASYLALHSSLFGPDGAVNYDYIVTSSINSINWLKMYFQWHTHTLTVIEPIWPMFQNL